MLKKNNNNKKIIRSEKNFRKLCEQLKWSGVITRFEHYCNSWRFQLFMSVNSLNIKCRQMCYRRMTWKLQLGTPAEVSISKREKELLCYNKGKFKKNFFSLYTRCNSSFRFANPYNYTIFSLGSNSINNGNGAKNVCLSPITKILEMQ